MFVSYRVYLCKSVSNPPKIFVIDLHFNEKYNCRKGFSAVFQDFHHTFLLFFVIAKMVFSGKIRYRENSEKSLTMPTLIGGAGGGGRTRGAGGGF